MASASPRRIEIVTQTKRTPTTGGAAGAGEKCFVGTEHRLVAEAAPKKQETISSLRRDFIAEALRIAAVKAAHAADDVELGDDICAERGISIVISHLKAAAQTFRELRKEEAR
jgi:hypothetical protein